MATRTNASARSGENEPSISNTLIAWYSANARDLPWRAAGIDPWAVLVSEVMLQQTPVQRVIEPYLAWMDRWPTPAAMAAASTGDTIRQWGRLGYPGRALRLHACATVIRDRHNGSIPADLDGLLQLPGVGDYTARAVLAFAFGQRAPVVDTNVRRVIARCLGGQAMAGPPSTKRDLAEVAQLLPADPARAAQFSIAIMELGALCCTAAKPLCGNCPIADRCQWRLAGSPTYEGSRARAQKFTGTDRQVRGIVMQLLRSNDNAVSRSAIDILWHDPAQLQRALDALIAEGLVDPISDEAFALPS